MREINRDIASAIIFSRDGKILMGQKDPSEGGSYADCWYIPGGGTDENESLSDAVIREVLEETGIELREDQLRFIPDIGSGTSEKLDKENNEMVIAHMKFHRFEVRLDLDANEIKLKADGEFKKMHWFSKNELLTINQISGGKEFFITQEYMDSEEKTDFKIS